MPDKFFLLVNENKEVFRIVFGLIIFIISLILMKPVSKSVLGLISGIIFRKDENKRNSLINSLLKPLKFFILALGIFLAIYINVKSKVVVHAFKITIILLICWALFNYLSDNLLFMLHFNGEDDKINTTALKFISNILKVLIVLFAVVMVISELGYNINGLITGLGVGGLAISLAAQDAVSNLISGFIIVVDKPFVDGDFIQSDSITGTVIEVSMRSTKIRTLDDAVVTVPNKILVDSAIINITMMEKRLIDIELGLVYSTPNELLEKCRSDIKEYLSSDDDILPYPLRVEFDRFEDSHLTLNILCYTSITDIHQFKSKLSEVNLKIKEIIENNKAEFAFPSTSVYIEKRAD